MFSLLLSLDDENGGPANITSVTLFGLIDHYREGDTTNTRIFYSDYYPKPAFHKIEDLMKRAHSYAKIVLPAMAAVRAVADQIEPLLGEEYKPFPSYEDLLYSVQ